MSWVPDPIRPYLSLVKLGLLVALLGASMLGGCRWQASRDADKLAAKDAVIAERNAALQAAADALRGAGAAIRTVNAQAEANVLAAMEQARRGADAAAAARRDAEKTAGRVASLERELEREKTTCTEGRARICGVPLR